MRENLNTIVRRAIAQHLRVELSEVRAGQDLARDLALQPLDVVLIALRLEEIESVELPFDQLDAIETVADLAGFLRMTRAEARFEAMSRAAAVRPSRGRVGLRGLSPSAVRG